MKGKGCDAFLDEASKMMGGEEIRDSKRRGGIRSGKMEAGGGAVVIRHRRVWVTLSVAACYAVYGLGLWARWGDHLSLAAALATPVVMAPIALVFYRSFIRGRF